MPGFNKAELKEILDGYYVNELKEDFLIQNFEIDPIHFNSVDGKMNCFISISNTRWNRENKKETNWQDGNKKIINHYRKCELIITERPIEELKDLVMQLIVKNSFAAIKILAKSAREKMKNPVIGITGSVGKSSTRLMLEFLLGRNKTIVATRGNHNTQVGVPLYGAKLCKNPEVGILEISLNALNNRGNQSLIIQPDVCIITSIGEAHLSTLHSKENIAKFKARIFAGLKKGGLVILNQDIIEFDILYQKALERTQNIKTYSKTNNMADLYLKSVKHFKYLTEIIFHYKEKEYRFALKMPSDGMIENALCSFLCIGEMGYNFESLLQDMIHFKSLDRVMEIKQLQTIDGRQIDILDDSHNAAVPSMLNAIETFKVKQSFYTGSKILAIGQIADLGEQSQQLHDQLLPKILTSGADFVFGHGHYMRKVIKELPSEMVGGWFDNAHDLAKRIPLYCSNDSLVLLKGSFSGSDFRLTSQFLPEQITASNKKLENYDCESISDVLQPSWGALAYNILGKNVIFTKGEGNSRAIEGVGPVILLGMLFKKGIDKNECVSLKKWPTNKGRSIRNKPFKTGEIFYIRELIEELIRTQHPSATYTLAHKFYGSSQNAFEEISNYAKAIGLSFSAVQNLTGRYRVKEQQSFKLDDLVKIGLDIFNIKNLIAELPRLQINDGKEEVIVLAFGHGRKAVISFFENTMICINGLKSIDMLEEVISDLVKDLCINA